MKHVQADASNHSFLLFVVHVCICIFNCFIWLICCFVFMVSAGDQESNSHPELIIHQLQGLSY